MADNQQVSSAATYEVATDKATISGDTLRNVQLIRPTHITGAEDSKTEQPITATTGTPAAAAMSVHVLPATSGGALNHHVVAAATTNAANVKASAGQVTSISGFNGGMVPVHLKLHNTAGAPTAGAGVVYTFSLQAGQRDHAVFPHGFAFSAGIGRSIVLGIADADANAVAATSVFDIGYK